MFKCLHDRTVALRHVKDGVIAEKRRPAGDIRIVAYRLTDGLALDLGGKPIPIHDRVAALTLADRSAERLRLLLRQPGGRFVRRAREKKNIDPAVRLATDRILRGALFSGPRLVPGNRSALKLFDDARGDNLVDGCH